MDAVAVPGLTGELIRDRVPHLALRTGEAIGVVGPLVRPGHSACLHCVDLRKAEADPLWPKILAQATFARSGPQACDTVLAAIVLLCGIGLALYGLVALGELALQRWYGGEMPVGGVI